MFSSDFPLPRGGCRPDPAIASVPGSFAGLDRDQALCGSGPRASGAQAAQHALQDGACPVPSVCPSLVVADDALAHRAHAMGDAQDVDAADDDEWNVNKASATCLMLFAQTVQDAIVDVVIPWASQNLSSPSWSKQEAAIMAFGTCPPPALSPPPMRLMRLVLLLTLERLRPYPCPRPLYAPFTPPLRPPSRPLYPSNVAGSILDGPSREKLLPPAATLMGTLVAMMRSTVLPIQDTAAWVIGCISEILPKAIADNLDPVMTVVLEGLAGRTSVANSSAWVRAAVCGETLGRQSRFLTWHPSTLPAGRPC